jgi:MFS transporter, MFS domain-containing protein family, molybdate-anion transporter
MYLFVFLWVPSLQEVGGSTLPLGYIFSAFMLSMILGSIIYTTIATTMKTQSDTTLPTNGHTNGHSARQVAADSVVVLHAKLAALICGVAALLFAYSATGSELSVEKRFWAFCAFEACVGAYYPVMGMLRGALVANEVRATVRMIIHQSSIRHVLIIMHSYHHFLGFHSIFS